MRLINRSTQSPLARKACEIALAAPMTGMRRLRSLPGQIA